MHDYHINIFYSDEDGGYIADIPDLDSCSAFGRLRSRPWLKLPRPSKPGSKRPASPANPSRRPATAPSSTR